MSDYLFATPGWLSGAARTGDMFGVFDDYNDSLSTQQADAIATASDWLVVGYDMLYAIEQADDNTEEEAA